MSDVREYRHKETDEVVRAIELRQYGDFVRALIWVDHNGGSAAFAPANEVHSDDYLIVTTATGNVEARVNWFVVRTSDGFQVWEGPAFWEAYEAVPVAPYVENDGPGTYVPRDRAALYGPGLGAAKRIPRTGAA